MRSCSLECPSTSACSTYPLRLHCDLNSFVNFSPWNSSPRTPITLYKYILFCTHCPIPSEGWECILISHVSSASGVCTVSPKCLQYLGMRCGGGGLSCNWAMLLGMRTLGLLFQPSNLSLAPDAPVTGRSALRDSL